MMEKFNCEVGATDAETCIDETPETKAMRATIEEDALTATEGAFEADFEELAGFSNDLPYELDPRSADVFCGKWNVPLNDLLRDMESRE